VSGSSIATSERSPRLRERWPTALALVLAIGALYLIIGEGDTDFAAGIAAMACIYMAAYAAGRPAMAWAAFPAVMVTLVALEAAGGLDSSVSGPALLFVLWLVALVRGRAGDGEWFAIQTSGMVLFGGLTLLAVAGDARAIGLISGIGFFMHGLWDGFHLAKNRVVNRPWAELCVVLDLIVGPALFVVALTT